MGKQDELTSYWIEFAGWPGELAHERMPPFPEACGVTAAGLDEALDLIHRGFYEDRELPPVAAVTPDVQRAPGPWAPFAPAPSGQRGIWHPPPLYPERTIVAEALIPEGWPPETR